VRKRGTRKRALATRARMKIPAGSERPGLVTRYRMDTLSSARWLCILTFVHEFTAECLGLFVGTSLTALRVLRELSRIIEGHGCPRTIVNDNGTEFT
jgi:putative transposase